MLCDVLGATPSQRLWTAALPLGDESEQQLVMEGHRRWIEAGVDILTSCTYQASVDGCVPCVTFRLGAEPDWCAGSRSVLG